jgi:hypothetical protein
MRWYNFLFRRPKAEKIKEETLVYVKPILSVFDYPHSKYRAYWETILDTYTYGWKAEVRFMAFDGNILEVHSVEGPTKANVEGLVEKLVKEKMENYKVA